MFRVVLYTTVVHMIRTHIWAVLEDDCWFRFRFSFVCLFRFSILCSFFLF